MVRRHDRFARSTRALIGAPKVLHALGVDSISPPVDPKTIEQMPEFGRPLRTYSDIWTACRRVGRSTVAAQTRGFNPVHGAAAREPRMSAAAPHQLPRFPVSIQQPTGRQRLPGLSVIASSELDRLVRCMGAMTECW